MSTIAPYEFVMKNIVKYEAVFPDKMKTGIILCLVDIDQKNWEVFAPGYGDLSTKRKYKIKKITGVIENKKSGRTRIVVRLYVRGFDEDTFKKDIEKYRKSVRGSKFSLFQGY